MWYSQCGISNTPMYIRVECPSMGGGRLRTSKAIPILKKLYEAQGFFRESVVIKSISRIFVLYERMQE